MRPSAILTSDWHIRGIAPKCRLDREIYLGAQRAKMDFIFKLANKYRVPILHAGDLGDKPEWPNFLLRRFIMARKNHDLEIPMFVIPGQHDLPMHRAVDWSKAGVGVLDGAGVIRTLYKPLSGKITYNGIQIDTAPFGCEVPLFKKSMGAKVFVLLIHRLLRGYKDNMLIPGESFDAFIKAHPEYDLIVSGDNHKTFIGCYHHTLLVNPGSLMRMSADQVYHEPTVFLWDKATNEIEEVPIPIAQGVVDREYIEEANKKGDRGEKMKAFTARVKGAGEMKISFERNLEQSITENEVSKGTQEKIWEATGDAVKGIAEIEGED